MGIVKDTIISSLSMKQITNKYNIPVVKNMCKCPFHADKTSSMRINPKGFYCFGCGKNGDFIQFVQNLFNLKFQEALDKINIDFNLQIQTRGIINKEQLIKVQTEYEIQKQKEARIKKEKNEKFIKLSDEFRKCNKTIKQLKEKINYFNWEYYVFQISEIQDKIELLDLEIEEIYK